MITNISMYDLLMTGIANILGRQEKYEESDEVSFEITKELLKSRRLGSLAKNLYNPVWNSMQRKNKGEYGGKSYNIDDELDRCIILSQIAKRKIMVDFFVKEKMQYK